MRIGIDISQIVYGTGVSVYTRNLVESLLRLDKKNDYVLFGGSLRQKGALNKFSQDLSSTLVYRKKLRGKVLPIPPTLADFLWNRLHILPIEKLIGGVDVFHSSDWTQPPNKAARVTTIHDLSFLRWPESVHPKVLAAQKRRLEWVKKEVDLVIAVSEATKKEIVELLGIPAENIWVIYEAAGKEFYPREKKEIEKTKTKYQIKGDYILAVGAKQPRKNLKRIIKAVTCLSGVTPDQGLPLVIVGEPGGGDEKMPDEKMPMVSFTGHVPNEDMPLLFSGARCFVYPSLYEGFGLPILEAFTCGCPVVTSNVSSMPEVAGDAAILVDPADVDDIARGIKEALKDRKKLAERGLRRLKLFSWEKTARETLGVYEEAYQIRESKRI